MGILGSLESFLTAERNQTTDGSDGGGDGGAGPTPTDARDSAGLYQCPDCETTYITGEMETCPECRRPVEAVPDGRDLGMR